MGLIRLLLAISVITAHSTPIFGLNLIQGQMAVEVFFMISGFYMALILTEKYNKKSDYKLFISNRLLKIFPTYWLILLFSIIFQIIYSYLHQNSSSIFAFFDPRYPLHPFTFITFAVSNLIILGQDILLFCGLNTANGTLFFTSNFRAFKPEIFNFFFISQAWTLSLEIMFYSIAPFLNKLKTNYLITMMSLSLGLRLFIYSKGLNHDPWNYRFFPTELIFFLAGILMYRFYLKIKNKDWKLFSIYSSILYISFLISYQFLPHERTKQLVLFIFSFFFIPFIFNFFKNNKLDRAIGELSYPVYISHFLIIDITTHFFNLPKPYLGLSTTIISILVSILISKYILNPINKHRQSRLSPAVVL